MNEAETEFFKRRRNLIAGSLLVTFVNLAGTEITQLNIFGNKFTIDNPKIIPVSFGIMLFYFTVRYFQYAHDIENKGFKKRFRDRVDKIIGPYLMKRELRNPKSAVSERFKDFGQIAIKEATLFDPRFDKNIANVSVCPVDGGVIDTFDLIVTGRDRARFFLIAGFYITSRTRLVTDYILPVLVAVFAFGSYAEPVRALLSNLL